MAGMQELFRFSSGRMHALIEGPQPSRLTLAVCLTDLATLPVDHLRRVREPVTRSKANVQGKVADVFAGRSRHAESQNELKAFRVLMATGRSDAWQEQPFCLEYHHEGAQHRYTPDILVVWGEHQEVVEIKEDSDAESPEHQARFAVIKELLAAHGFHFRVWKKSEICAEPRLRNATLILRYRSVAVPALHNEGIRRAFSSTPELPLRALCGNSLEIQDVLRLVLDGQLHIDWWEPLNLDSRVSRTPIGRQTWPSPPPALEEPVCRCTR